MRWVGKRAYSGTALATMVCGAVLSHQGIKGNGLWGGWGSGSV
jgi:hypothetical protein